MGFWVFMLVMDVLVPATMISYGITWTKHGPKEINSVSGYRTSMSMKNRDTWNFAHKYCGKLWYKWGLMLLPMTLIAMLCILGKSNNAVGIVGGVICFIQIIALIGASIPTEKALHKTFDMNGNRR